MVKKEYKILADRTAECLMEDLNKHGNEGWEVAMYVQEFGFTKVILVRDQK